MRRRRFGTSEFAPEIARKYSFCQNHGRGKWLYLKGNYILIILLEGPLFHFHDYGRKGTQQYRDLDNERCERTRMILDSRFFICDIWRILDVANVPNNLFVQSQVLFFHSLFLSPLTEMTWRDQRERRFHQSWVVQRYRHGTSIFQWSWD